MSVRDVIQAAAGASTTADKTYIEDVFSTYLYRGNGSTQTITNGIDLAGKGGMVWCKARSAAGGNSLYDTSRGIYQQLFLNVTNAQSTDTSSLTSFNNNGFSLGSSGYVNTSSSLYASWTFRKAPKFFDVVTYTGNGAARTISHNLGSAPGMMIIKRIDAADDWYVYHKNLTSLANTLFLDYPQGETSSFVPWNNTAPTSSNFSLSSTAGVNASGGTYVAYLFAHDTTTDGLIQCGSYTGNVSNGPQVTLGWQPQYVMIKNASGTGNWQIIDNMRGMSVGSSEATLQANLNNVESSVEYVSPTATGFQITTTNTEVNTSGATYIYMAIRRGPMRTPTDGTKVFQPVAYTGTNVDGRLVDTGIVTDMVMARIRTTTSSLGFVTGDRLRGNAFLGTAVTNAEASDADSFMTPTSGYGGAFSAMNGFGVGNDATRLLNGSSTSQLAYAFKRAPGFFDVVCYTGTGSNSMDIDHNLGVIPEFVIIKARSTTGDWNCWHIGNGLSSSLTGLRLNNYDPAVGVANATNYATPTTFHVSFASYDGTSYSEGTKVAYLFASCPGVSKVGSYTGNGTSQTINCGFSAGARFVLIKRTDNTGEWYVWDTARGIVAATDPHLSPHTGAEVTTDDTIDPESTGFIVNQVTATNVNVSGGSYIYLAIA